MSVKQMGELVDLVQAGKVTGVFIHRACDPTDNMGDGTPSYGYLITKLHCRDVWQDYSPPYPIHSH